MSIIISHRMGWKGAGLGKHENGTHHPPPLLAPRAPYRGLGATARTAHTKGPINFVAGSHPPAPDKQASRDPPPPDLKRDRPRIVAWKEGDNDSINMYGLFKPKAGTITCCELDYHGEPHQWGETFPTTEIDRMYETRQWRAGTTGIAEEVYNPLARKNPKW